MTWGEFLTTKFGLWIDMYFSTDNTFHSSGVAVKICGILLQIEKAAESSNGYRPCHIFTLENKVAQMKSNFITPRYIKLLYCCPTSQSFKH